MIDFSLMKGSKRFCFTGTLIIGNDESHNYRFDFIVLSISDVVPWSLEKSKYTIYTQVQCNISIKSADISSLFALLSCENGIIIGMLQFQRVSSVLDMAPYEAAVFFDSFIIHYHPVEENWFGRHLSSFSKNGLLERLCNDPTDQIDNQNLSGDDGCLHLYYYLFKSGGTTAEDLSDKDIFKYQLERDEQNSMNKTKQKLSDGRMHQAMIFKIAYTYWKDCTYVFESVRFRYVLN